MAASWFGVVIVIVSVALCFLQPRSTPKRFNPVALSVIALIVQMLLAHL